VAVVRRKTKAWWWLGVLAMSIQKPRLEVDDVLSKRVILRLHRLEVALHFLVFPYLLLEFFYVELFPLAERSLWAKEVGLVT
jgi:hypothetical protein